MWEVCWAGQHRLAGTLKGKFYFRLVKFLETWEEEQSRSDNQEQEDIDGAGEAEQYGTEKRSRRRYMVVAELQPPCYGGRKDDDRICKGVAECSISGIHDSEKLLTYRSIPNATRLCAYSAL